MKYLLIVGDGMSDFPVEALGGKTPLEYAAPRGIKRPRGQQMFPRAVCDPARSLV